LGSSRHTIHKDILKQQTGLALTTVSNKTGGTQNLQNPQFLELFLEENGVLAYS
jgi:hypothetical protein